MFKLEKLEKVLGKELTDKLRATFSNETKAPGETETTESAETTEAETETTETTEEVKEVAMSAAEVKSAIEVALASQAEAFNKQIEAITAQLTEAKEANTAKFTSMVEALELVAGAKEEAPERKADPMQKFTKQKQENFNSLLSIITQIKENK